ncbi:DNA-binding protein [Streptantibioticus cattleyicolor NRRL 8057 = DSM 46488]|uniref:DNA-binding protein n=1 Tax=Streptantibioticus cattleyicolor (strain ATCC 35852 / DSM 46488 / JCM 4925 / NBRC 14057 / NRRL 8057) TaxID=1003195 RepID=G8WWV0_STREN|nr:helix-turn-helix transcriptional regulator [Streptantibioticus cattleyicolor]AEW95464.1 DNA-binding protein [Streptantibioticus cattleyicolor NRRL 8057 = DSM 46488]MYS60030.1 helix-turn-helix domain-containing protein [Streptomyces sp. SID5468]
MSGATGAEGPEAFAQLLRELKDRSGLSYGALAKRLHMSTSTLHRYCNGTAVPHEYAPVERLARVCGGTPQELVELHRRWILADAERGRRADRPTVAESAREENAAEGDGPEPAGPPRPVVAPSVSGDPDRGRDAGDELVVTDAPGDSASPRRRRTALIASAAAATVLAAVVLVANAPFDGGERTAGDERAVGSAAPVSSRAVTGGASASASASPGASHRAPTAPGSSSGTPGAGQDGGGGRSAGGADTGSGATAPVVGVRPYVYDSPCSQHFLVDSGPAQMGPPASEQDAPRWSAAYGAVSSGEQRVGLTVQGTGAETVVLEALHVRVVTKGAPLAWNDYSMGVGCGGGVDTKSFDIDLDNGSPTVTVKNGQRDFPYKVSESDPEVFYVTAHTKAHDVRWDLALDWSSGVRHGTVHIDDNGIPFRTSAGAGRPGYDYPLGGGEWIRREG